MARRPSTNRRATAARASPSFSAERHETIWRGLCLLCSNDSPRSAAVSGVPFQGLRRSRLRRAGTQTERLTGTGVAASAPALITSADPAGILSTSVAEAVRYLSTPRPGVLSTLVAETVLLGVEGATESDRLLRCGRQPRSPQFRLRNLPTAICRPAHSPVCG